VTEWIAIAIARAGKKREYTFAIVDPKVDPRSRDDRYAEGWVANILLGGVEVARTSHWPTIEDAVAEGVQYLLGAWKDGA